jgi:hypothetical protein
MDTTLPVRIKADDKLPVIIVATPEATAIINALGRAAAGFGNCPTCKAPRYVPCITSGLEGVHSRNSRHYRNAALDARISDWPIGTRDALLRALSLELGPAFRYRLEVDHLHMENIA